MESSLTLDTATERAAEVTPARQTSVCRPRTSRSAAMALLLAVGAALTAVVVGAAPAWAHAVLIRSAPADGATLSAAPRQVVLEFDGPVSSTFATVVVTGPSGGRLMTTKPSVRGAKVAAALPGDLVSGAYRVAYSAVSDDGHRITGETRFRLELAPTGQPTSATAELPTPPPGGSTSGASAPAIPTRSATASAAAGAAAPGALPDERSGIGRFMWPITGAVLLLLAGVGVLVWERRRG